MSRTAQDSPNKPRPADPLVIAVADALARTERNYDREGSGPGSRFEGRLLEDVQAELAVRMTREHVPAARPPRYPTEAGARAACAHGWNLRCNRCGGYGANWLPGMRPGWGSLALCGQCENDLKDEQQRHAAAMRVVAAVNYEQERG